MRRYLARPRGKPAAVHSSAAIQATPRTAVSSEKQKGKRRKKQKLVPQAAIVSAMPSTAAAAAVLTIATAVAGGNLRTTAAQDVASDAPASGIFTPPCQAKGNCNRLKPIECYTCTAPEYWTHPSLPIGGYPASAECKGKLSGCLYCWKQHEMITTRDGWSSAFQYKSCAPFPVNAAGDNEYANHVADYCITTGVERTSTTCKSDSWCTKTLTECQCNVQHCNEALHTRIQMHQIVTMLCLSISAALLCRKCCLPG